MLKKNLTTKATESKQQKIKSLWQKNETRQTAGQTALRPALRPTAPPWQLINAPPTPSLPSSPTSMEINE
jgi:hypothetical protein